MRPDTHDDQQHRRRFRIWVSGRLGQAFVEGMDDTELGESPGGSTLDGLFVDQSHLHGILDRLWQLGIEVVKYETYDVDSQDPSS